MVFTSIPPPEIPSEREIKTHVFSDSGSDFSSNTFFDLNIVQFDTGVYHTTYSPSVSDLLKKFRDEFDEFESTPSQKSIEQTEIILFYLVMDIPWTIIYDENLILNCLDDGSITIELDGKNIDFLGNFLHQRTTTQCKNLFFLVSPSGRKIFFTARDRNIGYRLSGLVRDIRSLNFIRNWIVNGQSIQNASGIEFSEKK